MTHDGHMTPEKGRSALNVILVALVVLIVVLVVAGCVFRNLDNDTAKNTETTDVTLASNATDVEVFVIKMPPRDGNRLNSEGIAVSEDAEKFRAQIAEQAAEDPLTLWVYYMASPLGEKRPLENESVIAKDGVIKDGNVYSERGVEAYNDWLFLWEMADIEAVREITFQGYNTGVDGSKVTKSNGVGGTDKAGYDVAYRDVSGEITKEHSALERCTQPTFGGPVHWVPEGPTDCPPPTPPTKEVKGPNPYPNTVTTHQSSVPVPPPTPGYTPDNAKTVVEEQNRAPIGGTDSTPKGTPGTGSGGVTIPGDSSLPGGVSSPTPPPSNNPVPPAPPEAEKPPGSDPGEPN